MGRGQIWRFSFAVGQKCSRSAWLWARCVVRPTGVLGRATQPIFVWSNSLELMDEKTRNERRRMSDDMMLALAMGLVGHGEETATT